MEAQDAATAYFFKLWEWVENNVKTVIIAAAGVAVAAALLYYYFWQQNQKEVMAGQALTQLLVFNPAGSGAGGQLADGCLKIAANYPETKAGARAQVLAATALYANGRYTDAQAQFQKYLNLHPAGTFSASAALGLAACLDALGKTDAAADAYQRVTTGFSDFNAAEAARFALAQIAEQRGQFAAAERLYEQVAHDNPRSLLGSEAALHARQLTLKLPTVSSNASPVLFKPKQP